MIRFAFAVAALAFAAPARALAPEGARAEAAAAFSTFSQSRPVAQAKTSRARVTGTVTLTGHGHVQKIEQNSASLTLSGRATFTDASGKIGSGQVTVTYTGNFRVSNGRVDDKARPSVRVALYRDGKYVGTAQVSGEFTVTGRVDKGWYEVRGSGTLSGEGDVRD
jgi:hypothetical protein